mmetsp:Transcript_54594/g.109791  ORF Transcript_54594/g.109791 Transcript_54594/m.109791 type:complete len:103 (+) Transcript_54594:83-391(+)
MSAGWCDSAQQLQRIHELLKPYREDESQKDSPLLKAILKAQAELEKNQCTLHDLNRWHKAAQTQPTSSNQEAIVARSAGCIKELDNGISRVVATITAAVPKD